MEVDSGGRCVESTVGRVISRVRGAVGWAALVLGVGGAVSGSAASRMASCNCWPFSDGIDLMPYVELASRYCGNGICVFACPRDIPAQTCYSRSYKHSKHYIFSRRKKISYIIISPVRITQPAKRTLHITAVSPHTAPYA